MVQFCRDNEIPHEMCGKLVVATDEAEVTRLRALHQRGEANGLTGLRWLLPAEFRRIEPHAAGIAALHVPEEGITDYAMVVEALARRVQEMGGTIHTDSEVTRLQRRGSEWLISTPRGEVTAPFIINCAGLHCDRVCRSAGERTELKTVAFRGEYYRLKAGRQELVRNLIYPTPDSRFPSR